MLLVGLPYSEPELNSTRTGGTPYGASHVSGPRGDAALSPDEQVLAEALGRRLAATATLLERGRQLTAAGAERGPS
jgi:NAD(P)H dehydrogenase (quinone)